MPETLSTTSYLERKWFLQPDFTRDEYRGRVVCILDPVLSQSLMQEQEIQEVPDFFRFDNARIIKISKQLSPNLLNPNSKNPNKDFEFSAYKQNKNWTFKAIRWNNGQKKFKTSSKWFNPDYLEGLFLRQTEIDQVQNKQVHDVLISWWYEFIPYPEGKHIHGYHWPMCYIFPKYTAEGLKTTLSLDDTPVIAQIRRWKLVELGWAINRSKPRNKLVYNLFALKDNWGYITPQPINWQQHKNSTQDIVKTTLKIEGNISSLETQEWVYILKKHLEKYTPTTKI